MSTNLRSLVAWSYLVATFITFLGVLAITVFEAHVRWSLNQNFSLLDDNGLAGLAILLGMQMLGLVWLTKQH